MKNDSFRWYKYVGFPNGETLKHCMSVSSSDWWAAGWNYLHQAFESSTFPAEQLVTHKPSHWFQLSEAWKATGELLMDSWSLDTT